MYNASFKDLFDEIYRTSAAPHVRILTFIQMKQVIVHNITKVPLGFCLQGRQFKKNWHTSTNTTSGAHTNEHNVKVRILPFFSHAYEKQMNNCDWVVRKNKYDALSQYTKPRKIGKRV